MSRVCGLPMERNWHSRAGLHRSAVARISMLYRSTNRTTLARLSRRMRPKFIRNSHRTENGWPTVRTETGRVDLYVQPYPGPGKRITITNEGFVSEPAWSKNSNELFYRANDAIMSVRYKVVNGEFVPEKPIMLFRQPLIIGGTSVRPTYDVTVDEVFSSIFPSKNPSTNVTERSFPRFCV